MNVICLVLEHSMSHAPIRKLLFQFNWSRCILYNHQTSTIHICEHLNHDAIWLNFLILINLIFSLLNFDRCFAYSKLLWHVTTMPMVSSPTTHLQSLNTWLLAVSERYYTILQPSRHMVRHIHWKLGKFPKFPSFHPILLRSKV